MNNAFISTQIRNTRMQYTMALTVHYSDTIEVFYIVYGLGRLHIATESQADRQPEGRASVQRPADDHAGLLHYRDRRAAEVAGMAR
jgi:hypothetical protein